MESIDIIYLRKEIKDGILIPYIKKDLLGNKQVYIKNKAGEIISIGNITDLEKKIEE